MSTNRTPRFEKMLSKLPTPVQKLFNIQEERLQEDPGDSRLHVKKLSDMGDVYSLRVTREYRALFIWEGNSAEFFAIGNRKDVYR